MPTVSDQLRDWLSRVEILARGVEGRRAEAVLALERGRPWDARAEALGILHELPRSPVGLLLWADAAEAMLLDHEVIEALGRLGQELPFRADVWLRLALAQKRQKLDARTALERAAEAGEPVDAADSARMRLAALDLACGDVARAERWLDRLSLRGRESPEALRLRVHAWLDGGHAARATEIEQRLPEPGPADGAGWLVRGRALMARGARAEAAQALARAVLLDAPRAEAVAVHFVTDCGDPALVARWRELVEALGRADKPMWRAAFAAARGEHTTALRALLEAVRTEPTPELWDDVLRSTLQLRDVETLQALVQWAEAEGRPVDRGVRALARALATPEPLERLAHLDDAHGAVEAWARELRHATFAAWLPADAEAHWPGLLAEVRAMAALASEFGVLRQLEKIAADLERPLCVAILGEFNAGKSSFINALLGERVAPTGILPTTATLHRLVWSPDRFARISCHGAADRVVSHAALKSTLAELDPASVSGVVIYAPLELLRHVELVDTPGHNSADPRHAVVAEQALAEAHVVAWLLDATQPLKQSEFAALSRAVAAKLPLLVLINKSDRLGPDAREQVLGYVTAELTRLEVEPEAPPVLFSARLALEREGADPTAAEVANWSELGALIDRVLISRGPALRERALRTRLLSCVGLLAGTFEQRARARDGQNARWLERSRRLLDGAARLQSERERLIEGVVASVEREWAKLERDWLPVGAAPTERQARRYVGLRARAMAPALLDDALATLALPTEDAALLRIGAQPAAEVAVAALAPSLHGASGSELGAPGESTASGFARVVREELAALLIDELSRVACDRGRQPQLEATPAVELRLAALASCLEEWAVARPHPA